MVDSMVATHALPFPRLPVHRFLDQIDNLLNFCILQAFAFVFERFRNVDRDILHSFVGLL